jgi:hypothetical protein
VRRRVLPDARRAADWRDADRRDAREVLRCDFDEAGFFGTFAPALRASERPIAMACLRLVTFFPLRPLFSVPVLRSRMARATLRPAFGLYLRPPEDRFVAAMENSPFHGGKR